MSLVDYAGSGSEAEAEPLPAAGARRLVTAAPAVADRGAVQLWQPHDGKELRYNAKADELYAPLVGPLRPGAVSDMNVKRNTWTGFIEDGDMNMYQFENQRLTMVNLGYAMDPSSNASAAGPTLVGDLARAVQYNGDSMVHVRPNKADRKRKTGSGPDGDSYLAYEDEVTESKPTAEQMEILEGYAKTRAVDRAKRMARRFRTFGDKKEGEEPDEDPDEAAAKKAALRDEENTTFHLPEAVDYQGRSFMEPPLAEGVRFGSAPEKCHFPQKLIHTWDASSKGVSAIRFIPQTAHLLLSAGMDGLIKLWEVYGERRLVRSYVSSQLAVRDISFNADGSRFVSCSYDRLCRVWDTETGKCIGRYTSKKLPYCVKFHPAEDKQHLFVAGTQDKKIICFDINTAQIVQEYDRHLGPVNAVAFYDDGRRMVSTSDDKSIRVWEWDIPVDVKYIADPAMHSMPSIANHPSGKWLLFQSMDNQIITFGATERFKQNRRKVFKGHIVAGYSCQIDCSPDGAFVISGDAHGNCFIWDWKTKRIVNKLKAHDKVCVGVQWNPNEVSKLATCGWDGKVKYWA